MAGEPLISFVVPCYNTRAFAAECLHSIFAQHGSYSFEVIALDDASPDGTAEVLRSFADARLRLILHTANQGFVATISEGLLAARGRFVCRIDSDDRYRPDFLEQTVPRLLESPRVGLVYGGAAIMGADGQIQDERWDRIHFGGDACGNEFVALLHRNYICAPTVIARRELWLATLPVPEGLAFTDWYHNFSIARRSDFYYVDRALADYRVHAGGLHTRMFLDGAEERTVRFLLDRVFSETETTPELQQAKLRARNSIYAHQLISLADKYFGASMNTDARRCYLEAIRHTPALLRNSGVLRRTLATILGRRFYDRAKDLLQRPA